MYTALGAPGAPSLRLTIYPSTTRVGEGRTETVASLRDLRRVFRPVAVEAKDDLPLVMRRHFDGARTKENARGPALLVLDVDDGLVPPIVASGLLSAEGVPHLIYETWSSSPSEPRFRVVAPATVDDRGAYRRLALQLFRIMGCPASTESWAVNSGVHPPHEGAVIIDRLGEPWGWLPEDEGEDDDSRPRARDMTEREGLDYERARSALEALPCEGLSYDEWLQVGMALKSTGDSRAFSLWDEWSAQDAGRYQAEGAYSTAEKWETLAEDGGVTIASLYRRAVSEGWRPPRRTASEDFAGVEDDEPPAQPDPRGPLAPDGWPLDYEACLREISRQFALVVEGGQARVYETIQDEGRVILYSEKAFRLVLNAVQRAVPGERQPRMVGMGDAWLRDFAVRRFYREIAFNPNKGCPPSTFNLWRGWPWRKFRSPGRFTREVDRFLDHLQVNICGRDEQLYAWLLSWISQMVQEPGVKPGTACVLTSGQGTGKSLTGLILSNMLGDYGLQVDNLEMLTSNFNAHTRTNIFTYADEVTSGGAGKENRKAAQKLKSIITGFEKLHQPKGVDATKLASYTRLMFSTNEPWALLADADDRRHTVFDVSTEHKEDHAYFAPIYDNRHDRGFLKELFAYFRDVDRTGLPNVFQNMRTAGLDRQKIESLYGVTKWWYEVLRDGRLPGDEAWVEDPPTMHLYQLYEASVSKHERPTSMPTTIPVIEKMTGGTRTQGRVRGKPRQIRMKIGTLQQARDAFEKFLNLGDSKSLLWEKPVYFEEDEE